MNNRQNIAKAKAIEQKNKKRLLAVNPKLDEKERYYITLYAKNGYQSRNKDTGGSAGKQELGERKPSKGYREGVQFGKKTLARELSSIISKHLTVRLKEEKQGNKVSEKQFEKFNQLLDENNYFNLKRKE